MGGGGVGGGGGLTARGRLYLGLKRIVVFSIRIFFNDNYRIFEYSFWYSKVSVRLQ